MRIQSGLKIRPGPTEVLRQKIAAALRHPDAPWCFTEVEIEEVAAFIAARLTRKKKA